MSRRGFLRNILGVTAAIVVPTTQIIVPDYKAVLENFLMEKLDVVTAMNDCIRQLMWENSLPRLFFPPDPIPNTALQFYAGE